MLKISVVVIAYNEAKNIERLLSSVSDIAFEVIVVDSNSSDGTAEICARFGAIVLQRSFDGYSAQKNFGNSHAKGEYILSLDADECLSDELKQSLKQLTSGEPTVFSMNRLTNYCGTWMKHGAWYPDVKVRLWPNGKAKWQGHIHEVVEHALPVQHLKGDILHYSYSTISEHMLQLNKFTDLSVQELVQNGKTASFRKMWLSPVYSFFKGYILKRGFVDGYHGFILALFNSFSTFLKYAKLKEIKGKRH